MANPAGPPSLQPTPATPMESPRLPQPGPASFAAPSFYITGRQPLSPTAILLAIVAAVVALALVLYVLGYAAANPAAGQKDSDDPDQIDVIVVGDPGSAAAPAHQGDHVSPVHPTIIVHLPRFGDQMGLIPNTPAGHLLYNWLGGFNQASYPALANALPTMALRAVTTAQLELRQQTGGFSLLSAKEVEPGVLVFRLRDQTPAATEVLGALQVRPNASPATIASFSLHAVSSPRRSPTTAPAALP